MGILTIMTNKDRYIHIKKILDKLFPNAQLELIFENGYQLFVATILSARCTDKIVNEKTPALFKKYPSFSALSHANNFELITYLKDITYAESKAQQLISSALIITEKFNGTLPPTIIDLLALPGIGRKSANLIVSELYNTPAIAVDTHVSRVSQRIGLAPQKDLFEQEKHLMRIIPQTDWIRFTRQAILFGRYICTFNAPKCTNCSAKEFCNTYTPNTPDEPSLF